MKMGVREFRDNFTTIAREAKGPVIVTNHDRIIGWFTPASRPPRPMEEILAELEGVRRRVEARGVDIDARLKEIGLDDETLFGEPGKPPRRAPSKSKTSRRKK
jgi:hypothetical protein